jgi:putative ABC transport system substrate-binding protein
LSKLGYIEGKNLAIEYRWAEGKPERFPSFAVDLVRLKVDVIVAATTPAAQAAKNATETLPIVMVVIADPVGSGHVHSLARPGGNITGLSFLAADFGPKQLQLLMAYGLVYEDLWRRAASYVDRILKGANPADMPIEQPNAARDSDELAKAIASITAQRAEALSVLADPLFAVHRGQIAALAIKALLPSASGFREFADAGGLLAYGPNFHELNRATAAFVHRILQGANPSDLPVEEPTKFELIINLKTAKALNLTIPPSLLARADQVIE